ncbi:MAG: ClpXP protease specificity-enhancing factor [Burkholderiales bacterium]|nr:ClpXP protease specificity-enhancing factor [Burkholderiales bacterium]
MSEQSAKPYLVRALYEWCVDQGYTPYLAVRVNGKTRVPAAFVKNGEIVLNVGPLATHQLTMDNDWVLFNARFNGVSQEVAVPFSAVIGIFAKETGYGMGFQPMLDAAGTEATDASPEPAEDAGPTAGAPDHAPGGGVSSPGKGKVSHLKVVK